MFFRWGTVNEMLIQPKEELLKLLQSKLEGKKVDLGFIEGADHGYTGKEDKLAEEIIVFIKEI